MIKIIQKIIIILIILFISLFAYTKYILYNPPLKKSFLENQKIITLYNYIGFYYHNDFSNYLYSKLAKQYRKDLKYYYKPLSDDEQKKIWTNYLKIYKLQNMISIKIALYNKQMIIYEFKAKSYDVDAKFKVSWIQCIYKTIKINFTNLPIIDIDIKDKKLYNFIETNTQQTYKLLEKNRKLKK